MQISSAMIPNTSLKSLNNYVNQFTKPTSAVILSIKAPVGSAYGSEYILKTGFGGSLAFLADFFLKPVRGGRENIDAY